MLGVARLVYASGTLDADAVNIGAGGRFESSADLASTANFVVQSGGAIDFGTTKDLRLDAGGELAVDGGTFDAAKLTVLGGASASLADTGGTGNASMTMDLFVSAGVFDHSGGMLTANTTFFLANNAVYNLNGGTLVLGNGKIGTGSSSTGVLNWNGGTISTPGFNEVDVKSGTLNLGQAFLPQNVLLREGAAFTATNLTVGSGTTLQAEGGTVTVETLTIAGDATFGDVFQGQLNAENIVVQSGGQFTQNDALFTATVTDSVTIKDGGTYNNNGQTLTLTSPTASFAYEGQTESDVAGFADLTLQFMGAATFDPITGLPTTFATLEAMSEDKMAMSSGFVDNFGIEELVIGSSSVDSALKIVDAFNNDGLMAGDAVYVERLILGANSFVDVGDVNLYIGDLIGSEFNVLISGSGSWTDLTGSPSVAPEPATLVLLALSLGAIGPRRATAV